MPSELKQVCPWRKKRIAEQDPLSVECENAIARQATKWILASFGYEEKFGVWSHQKKASPPPPTQRGFSKCTYWWKRRCRNQRPKKSECYIHLPNKMQRNCFALPFHVIGVFGWFGFKWCKLDGGFEWFWCSQIQDIWLTDMTERCFCEFCAVVRPQVLRSPKRARFHHRKYKSPGRLGFFVGHFSRGSSRSLPICHFATHQSLRGLEFVSATFWCNTSFVQALILQRLGCAELSAEAVLAWASSLKIDDAICNASFAGGQGDNKGGKGASATRMQRFLIVSGIRCFSSNNDLL